jgi:hypothetical protein
VRKIIGFKLQLRLKDIPLLEKAARTLKPAVLFDTYAHPDPDQAALSPMPGLAYSLVLTSLGKGLADFREKSRQESPQQVPLWDLAEEAALDEAMRFATAILEDEAARESCLLSPLTTLSEPAALETVVRKLDGAKIGVALDSGKLAPSASAACSLSWLSKTKGRGKK